MQVIGYSDSKADWQKFFDAYYRPTESIGIDILNIGELNLKELHKKVGRLTK